MLKKLLIIFVFLVGAIYSTCMAQNIAESEAYAIAVCGSGNSCVVGLYQTGQGSAMYTIKYGPSGDTLWTRVYSGNGAGENKAYAICVDNDGCILVAGCSTDTSGTEITTLKYNSVGDLIWVRTYPPGINSGEEKAYAITVDPLGDVFVTGAGSSVNGLDMVTIKYDSAGVQQWVERYNGAGNSDDVAYSIALTTNYDVVVTGFSRSGIDSTTDDYTTIKYSNGGGQVWVATYSRTGQDVAKKVLCDDAGNVYVTGYSWCDTTGFDIVTVKYNSSGAQLWAQLYDNPAHSDDIAYSMALVSDGVIVTGSSKTSTSLNSENYITLKYDQYGNTPWTNPKLFSTNGDKSVANSVAVSEQTGIVYVTGASQHDTTAVSSDMATVMYDLSTGELVDSVVYNGPTNGKDVANDVKVDSSGNAYVTGFSSVNPGHLTFCPPATVKTLKYNFNALRKQNRTNNIVPGVFILHQNYPNPFNPSTTIKFDISKSSNVKLVVYNILGQQIATLMNEYKKSGNYQIVFSMPKLSSGVYFYVLTAGSYRDVKKMVLIK
jgi:hypothetical protein